MHQLELNILGRIDGPRAVPMDELAKAHTYREACIECYLNRRVANMTWSRLSELTGMRASHISDYFSVEPVDGHGRERREMPGKYIPAVELAFGNTFISQWLAAQTWSAETVREALATERKVA